MGSMLGRVNFQLPSQQSSSSQFQLDTDVSDEQAKEMGATVTREQFERYMNEFVPQEDRLIRSLGRGHAEEAAGTSLADSQRARAALDRMRSRYGTSLTAGQRRGENRAFSSDRQLSALGAINIGRQMDEDRDYNLRGGLLNIGNNLSASATGGLADASINAQNRENAHEQAKAQHSAQQQQQMASTVSSLATAAVIF